MFALGQPFDADKFEAITTVPVQDKSPNFAPSKSARKSVFKKFRKMFD
ncbi:MULTISPECIES: hypothetical protein [Proteiniphilum]|nr:MULTISPECIES: hypothetical protein [Proteiniphilum]ULB34917.1 hypothetical protein KDN43_02355 [Proteiniphilum propionicum]